MKTAPGGRFQRWKQRLPALLLLILPLLGLNGLLNALPSTRTTAAPDTGEETLVHHDSGVPDFNHDVLPILSENCFQCHGPDPRARKGKLRLDTREGTFAQLRNGRAIVPNDPEQSLLLTRVSDADAPMPPAPHKRLSSDQVETLRRWIVAGASWEGHWAFAQPKRARLPAVQRARWARNPIDKFILARMEREGMPPAPEADRRSLVRRLYLDLTGLAPTLRQVDDFLADTRPEAYELLVERLLDTPAYAENMARHWLDLARYGDTHGTHLDNYRAAWPYRDYVIRAFSGNKPYDQFLIEQIAGDLLPNATTEHRVATGFLRNQISTGDIDSLREAEARFASVAGMTETTAQVVLGMTLNCARCHDHKFDPLSQRDYYRLYAYFNNNDGPPFDFGAPYPHPAIAVPTAQDLKSDYDLRVQIAKTKEKIQERAAQVPAATGAGPASKSVLEKPFDYIWLDDEPKRADYTRFEAPVEDCFFATGPDHPVLSGKQSIAMRGSNQMLFWISKFEPTLIIGEDDVLFAYVWIDPARPPRELVLEWLSEGWDHRAFWGEDLAYQGTLNTTSRRPMGPVPAAGKWVRLEVPAKFVGLKPGMEVVGVGLRQFQGACYWDKVGSRTCLPLLRTEFATFADWLAAQQLQRGHHLPTELRALIQKDAKGRTTADTQKLREHYLAHASPATRPQFADVTRDLRKAEVDLVDLHYKMPRTLVFQEAASRRPTYFFDRGDWDKPGEAMERGTPGFLPPMRADVPNDRLGLARWITSPEHPLTARVAVSRLWHQVFKTSLVRTPEDFGLRADRPSHPDLLDWLAVEFRAKGWDVKSLLRLMVTSATYRQSSRITPEHLAVDPENRLMARSARVRLDAETLRDQALVLGGLLVDRVGGPSVKPPQPPGVWEAISTRNSNTKSFVADTETEKIYRRSMYTFWKRTAHPPQMSLLDAPTRETSVCRRERTNTPMQALLLLNEEQFLEAARGLARYAMRQAASADRLDFAFRCATARPPTKFEHDELQRAFDTHRRHFAAHPEQIGQLLPGDWRSRDSELAGLTMVTHLILNLDEVLNRP